MNAFRESRRLQRVFSAAAGGSFRIVYLALSECSVDAEGENLKEADVLSKIRSLIAQPRGVQ